MTAVDGEEWDGVGVGVLNLEGGGLIVETCGL